MPRLFFLLVHVINFIFGFLHVDFKKVVLMLYSNWSFSKSFKLINCLCSLLFEMGYSLLPLFISALESLNLFIKFLNFIVDVLNTYFIFINNLLVSQVFIFLLFEFWLHLFKVRGYFHSRVFSLLKVQVKLLLSLFIFSIQFSHESSTWIALRNAFLKGLLKSIDVIF